MYHIDCISPLLFANYKTWGKNHFVHVLSVQDTLCLYTKFEINQTKMRKKKFAFILQIYLMNQAS